MILYPHQMQQEARVPKNRYSEYHLALYLAYIYCLILNGVVVTFCDHVVAVYFYHTMDNKVAKAVVNYDVSDFQVVRPYHKKQVTT